MDIITILFYLVTSVIILSSVSLIIVNNTVHAALLLVLILLSNIAIGNTDDVQESKALDLDTTPTTSQPISIPIQNSAPQTDNSEE